MGDPRQSPIESRPLTGLPVTVSRSTSSFVHLHSSSLNSVPALVLRRAFLSWVKRHSPDVLTITEVQGSARASALRSSPQYQSFRGRGSGANQCAIVWRTAGFPGPIVHSVGPITRERYWTKSGALRPLVHATTVVLTDQHGHPLLVSVAHYPPSIQGPHGFTGIPRRVAVALSAVAGHRAHVRQAAADYRALTGVRVRFRVVCADWNVDARKAWVRAWHRATFPRYRVAWRKPYPRLGTLGTRLIDTPLIRGLKVTRGPGLLSKQASASDHRALVSTYQPRPRRGGR